jgi:penicillin-binding protein 2
MSQDLFKPRFQILQATVIVLGVLLIFRCFQIQIWDKSYQQKQSFRQIITQYPSRGLIYDRNDSLLIYNQAMYDLQATYETVKRSNIDTLKLCKLLGISKEEFSSNMEKNWNDKRFSKRKPFDFISKMPADSFAIFEEHLFEFRGFESIRRNVRGYPVNVAAHILGYISEVTPRQIEKKKGLYQRGDYIGASGIEQFYEEQLRGTRGEKHVLKDKWGKIQSRYKNGSMDRTAISGYDLVTTLDIEIQRYAEELMKNKIGAIVAIEPSSGEILAMVSAPSYDPFLLSVDNNRGEAFMKLSKDSTQPLFNRALMAQYPPGSIFKTVLAAIALQENAITANTAMSCGGAFVYGPLSIGCHAHGATANVSSAIQYSCNNYFCETYRQIINLYGYDFSEKGMSKLIEHLNAFGLGRKMGVDIPGEMSGNIPSIGFFDKKYGRGRWRFSNSASIGIGQGELQITPLQMANLTAIIANRGFYYIPHFAKEFKGDKSGILNKYKVKQFTKVHPRHFEPVIDGMEQVIVAGTGRRAFIPDISICGKTGTVQNPHGISHSTFIAFAPKENPKIAIAVYVENSGWGSSYAAPIASLIIEKYLKGEVSESRKELEKSMLEANLMNKYMKIPVDSPQAD